MSNLIATSLNLATTEPFKLSQIFLPDIESQNPSSTLESTGYLSREKCLPGSTPVTNNETDQWSTASITTSKANALEGMEKFILKGGCSKTFPRPETSPRHYPFTERKFWTKEEHRHWKRAYEDGAIDGIGHRDIIDHL
ncbi:unnamed protein product, partial [Mesorhabditis belari]|uniref:Uncharacterized protein n=1 Tax=Mesorhabditis belari TaxID=2138241 RepID=A0AAF3EWV3_9BILA